MNVTYISASDLKRDISTILNEVAFGRKIAVIERHGKAIAKIVPMEEKKGKKKDMLALLNKYYGAIPDFPDVTKERRFRKRHIVL